MTTITWQFPKVVSLIWTTYTEAPHRIVMGLAVVAFFGILKSEDLTPNRENSEACLGKAGWNTQIAAQSRALSVARA